MVQFDVSIVINKPVNIVVDALMNHNNFVYWQTNLEKFEVIKETEEKAGSIAKLHYNEKGRKYIMEDKMIQYEPNKKIVSQVSGDVISAVVETIILSQGDKTEIKLKWSGEGKVFFPDDNQLVADASYYILFFKDPISTRARLQISPKGVNHRQ